MRKWTLPVCTECGERVGYLQHVHPGGEDGRESDHYPEMESVTVLDIAELERVKGERDEWRRVAEVHHAAMSEEADLVAPLEARVKSLEEERDALDNEYELLKARAESLEGALRQAHVAVQERRFRACEEIIAAALKEKQDG